MHDLPAEIYTNIFLYLKRKDLQKCYFVCKSWYTVAIPLGWKAVTLRDRNVSLVQSHLNNFDRDQYFKNSRLITKLTFQDTMNYRDSYRFNRLELLELLNQLPNLNEIYFSVTYYPDEYVGYLLDADMQHINNIDTGYNLCDVRSDLLFSVYYKFRNSITFIRLLYDRNLINFNSQQTNTLGLLTQFKKLTKLIIHNLDDINLTPFQIQDNCPNLEHLEFVSGHPISESAMRHILDDNRRINLNFISSLVYLDLCLPSLSDTYTRYLVDYFPNQLTGLDITISRQNIFNWIDIVGMELALRLMEKAGGIDKTYIGFVLCEKYQVRANNENNMTKYFMLLNSFRGTQLTHCTAKFNDPVSKMRGFGYSFRYDIFDELFVTYNIYKSDLYRSTTADMAVPDKTSSIIGPEIFHVLEFNLSSRYDGEVYRVLNYSLSNCPRLQSLKIVCYLDECVHSSLSFRHKNGKISSDQAKCDINFLQMEKITAKCLDLVTTHLHNIEIVSLRAKDWSRKYNDPVIDLTGFKKLKSFIYTSTDKCSTKENKFVLIKYTNGTERCVFENGKTKDRDYLCFIVLCKISVSLDFREEEMEF